MQTSYLFTFELIIFGAIGLIMNNLVNRLLFQWAGNNLLQRLLENNITISQYLIGIGSGSNVASSGEHVLIYKLRLRAAQTEKSLCIFDVGANQGQFLRLMHDGLRDSPTFFHAFEPW